MKTKKSFKLLLAGVLLASGVLATSATVSASKSFTDLNTSPVYSKSVKHLNSLHAYDYKSGTKLKGNSVVTRAEASKIFYNLYKKKLKKVRTFKNSFTDTKNKKFSKEMIWAYEVGIFNTSSNKKFNPSGTITKAQMTTIIAKTFKLKKGKKSVKFKDVKSTNSAYKSINILASNSIAIKDRKGNFNPKKKLTINHLSYFINGVMKVKPVKNLSSKVYIRTEVGFIQVDRKVLENPKDFADVKVAVKKLYESPKYGYRETVLYTGSDMYDRYLKYSISRDISQYIPGYTSYGVHLNIQSERVAEGVYRTVIFADNEREKAAEILWKKKMDNAKKYIIANYKLETDYDVVSAIVDFVDKQIEYGADVPDDHPYLEWRGNMTNCWGYTDLANEMYKRFGIESRVATGGAHAWNIVKVGGKWYHSDATFNDDGLYEGQCVLMTESERTKTKPNNETTFRATNTKFDMSMALPYKLK